VKIAELLRQAAAQLPGEPARFEAEHLLAWVLRVDRAWLFAHSDAELETPARQQFEHLLNLRCAGEPLAYLLGRRGFWNLDLKVNPAVLIPRAETELLVEQALVHLPENTSMQRIADLGTGSGAVALALAKERPLATVVATDVSAPALALAVKNAQAHSLDNVWFRRGHWCAALGGERFDMIVSNPPYIASDDPHLQQGDLRFEPPLALVSGSDGLAAIREIIRAAPDHLVEGGWLLLEHGYQQGAAICALLEQAGFSQVQTACDLEQRPRVTKGRWRRSKTQNLRE